VPFIPTGGITVEDAPKYIAAGAIAVGVGSALTVGTDDEIAARVQGLLQALARAA
jgi:2-dehydro-3-deoxyphosphogluconate aldolase/(4S)-4-hydroxy-2-oxoglutarate aldolase